MDGSAVGHVVEGQGVGELARAVEIQAVGVREETDHRAGDGVVAVGNGVDDGFVGAVVEIAGDGIASSALCPMAPA